MTYSTKRSDVGQDERVAVTIPGSQVVLTGASGGLGGALAHALDVNLRAPMLLAKHLAESGATGKVGTVTSSAVADAVIRAIQKNKAEVDVAPRSVRLAAAVAHHLPETFARLARRSGADQQTAALAAGLRHKR